MDGPIGNIEIEISSDIVYTHVDYAKNLTLLEQEINWIVKELYPERWNQMYLSKGLGIYLEKTAIKCKPELLDNLQTQLNLLGPNEFMKRWRYLRKIFLRKRIQAIIELI